MLPPAHLKNSVPGLWINIAKHVSPVYEFRVQLLFCLATLISNLDPARTVQVIMLLYPGCLTFRAEKQTFWLHEMKGRKHP